jgi:hypothetical protein
MNTSARRSSDPRPERLEVLLALTLPTPPPPGPTPTLAEIEAWQCGRLTDARSAEVLAHVARDPVCYQQWFELRRQAASPVVTTGAPPVASRWRRFMNSLLDRMQEDRRHPALLGGGLATALVLILTVGLLAPWSETSEWERMLEEDQARWGTLAGSLSYVDWVGNIGTTRGEPLPTAPFTLEQQSFQAGLRATLASRLDASPEGSAILDGLAHEPGRCPDRATEIDPACHDRQILAQTFGQWTALAYLACTQGQAEPVPLGQRLDQWAALTAARQLDPWQAQLDPNAPMTADPPCDRIRGLIATALQPPPP